MNFKLQLLLIIFLLSSGCVTTNTGDMSQGASKEDAARLNMDLGISYLRQGDLDQAVIKLEKSIAEEPNNATAHRALGLVYEALGDNVGAEKEYRTAVKQAPADPDALNQLAVFICIHGSKQEAMTLFDRALAVPRYQSRYMLYTNAGTCEMQENLAKAEEYFRRALAVNSVYPEALFQMADVTYRREYYLQSRAFVERYLNASQPTPGILWLAYRVESELQDMGEAQDFAEQLLREFPDSVEARMLLDERRNAG
jgi:type IV pilus assembly protein PilF